MKCFFDTSVLVAASLADHEHYTRARSVVKDVRDGNAQGFVSAHTILETYATLTRLPRTPRVTPDQAATLIADIASHFTVIGLTAKEYGDLIAKLGRESVVGAQAYDALHLACAEKTGVDRIYTFNCRHFQHLAPIWRKP